MNKFKNSAPGNQKTNKEMPFMVPDNYFTDFPARLQSRLQTESEVLPHEKRSIIRYLKPALGLAASFALIFLLVYWPVKTFLPDYMAREANVTIDQESETDTYMPSIERIDENTFFGLLFENLSETEEEFNDEELLNYLSANVSDYELYLHTEN
jgi:hypothetical protein